jgi:hypothetical protein
MERAEVYKLIDGERDYQEKVWQIDTENPEGNHTPTEWLVYIQRYLNKAIEISTDSPTVEANLEVMEIIRKIGAMSVCAMETNDTPPRIIL